MDFDGKIVGFDIETTVKDKEGKFAASPFHKANRIVLACFKNEDGEKYSIYDTITGDDIADSCAKLLDKAALVVGCNLKFDLTYAYLRREKEGVVLPAIWDVALAEYVLTAQARKFPSLNDMAFKYLGPSFIKDDKIKAYWDEGVETEEIPRNELTEYCEKDVHVAMEVFRIQWQEAEKEGQLPLILSLMDAWRAVISMHISGLTIHGAHISSSQAHYEKLLSEVIDDSASYGYDITSLKDISNRLFGGRSKVKIRKLVGKYKNGKDKWKTEEEEKEIEGLIAPVGTLNTKGYYSTDDNTLKWVAAKGGDAGEIARQVMQYRHATKILETFYAGIIKAAVITDGEYRVHADIHPWSTSTGRYSCSNPNIQNQTDEGEVKGSYVSRYGWEGKLVEFDYAQLEVVWLAHWSQDKQLIEDIRDRVDIHSALYFDMYGRMPTAGERKAFKPRTFALIYGAGAHAIAEQAGITLAEAKRFMHTFFSRYPDVKKKWDEITENSELGKETMYSPDVCGPMYRWTYKTETGRKYLFINKDKETSFVPGHLTFSPTQLRNWPVQGGATGDFVPTMLGVIYNILTTHPILGKLWKENKVRLVMTVHDSFLLDVHEEAINVVTESIYETLVCGEWYLKDIYNIDFNLPVEVNVTMGPSWLSSKRVKVNPYTLEEI